MKKKERVFAAIRKEAVDHVPTGFSLHFPKEIAFGDAAVDAHIRFFEESDTDILKIMNENLVPYMGEIHHGSDYQMVREMSLDDSFMQDQLLLVKKILTRCDRSAFTLGTLHGITASAIHPLEKMDPNYTYDGVRNTLCRLLREGAVAELTGAGTRRVTLRGGELPSQLPGAADLRREGDTASFLYSGSVDSLLEALRGRHLADLHITEPDLEEIFLHYYEGGDGQ